MQRPSRIWAYIGTGVVVAALGIALQPFSWRGRGELHALMELAAVFLALMAGIVALIRYCANKNTNAALEQAGVRRDAALLEAEEARKELQLIATAFQSNAKIIITDAEANILRVNRGFTRMTGYSEQEAIGANPRFLQSGCHDEKFYREMWGALRKDGVWEGEIWDRCKDGKIIAEHVLIAAVKNEKKETTHFVASGQDITAQKLIEARLRESNEELEAKTTELEAANQRLTNSNEQLQQFAYVASHDLQEPLRKVTSFCQILQEEYGDNLDDDAQTYINYAVGGAQRMKVLISDLLDYSRVETQGKPLAPADAMRACAEAIDNLQLSIEETGAEIVCAPLPIIHADYQQLVRLFQNLIGNAIKYRAERPVEVHVGAEGLDDEWVVHVQDNGIGIEPQYAARIFQIFQRLHARNEYSGTGIGLAICKRIVDRLGGRIWVDSRSALGSTFFFTAPKIPSEQQQGVDRHEYDRSNRSLATVG